MGEFEIRTVIREQADKIGLDPLEWIKSVEEDSGRYIAKMKAHPSQGSSKRIIHLPSELQEVRSMIRRQFLAVSRLIERDRDIEKFGGDKNDPPAWAHFISQDMKSILVSLGVDLENVIRPGKKYGRSDVGGCQIEVQLIADDTRLRGFISETHARLRIETQSFRIADTDSSTTIEFEGQLPHNIMACAIGRPVKEVIDHAYFHDFQGSIERVENITSQWARIWIARRHVHAAPAPEGISPNWAGINLGRENLTLS